jgi:hypothetical protein
VRHRATVCRRVGYHRRGVCAGTRRPIVAPLSG